MLLQDPARLKSSQRPSRWDLPLGLEPTIPHAPIESWNDVAPVLADATAEWMERGIAIVVRPGPEVGFTPANNVNPENGDVRDPSGVVAYKLTNYDKDHGFNQLVANVTQRAGNAWMKWVAPSAMWTQKPAGPMGFAEEVTRVLASRGIPIQCEAIELMDEKHARYRLTWPGVEESVATARFCCHTVTKPGGCMVWATTWANMLAVECLGWWGQGFEGAVIMSELAARERNQQAEVDTKNRTLEEQQLPTHDGTVSLVRHIRG